MLDKTFSSEEKKLLSIKFRWYNLKFYPLKEAKEVR